MTRALETLEKLGYTLTLRADGNIHIRGKPSPEADAALAILREHGEDAYVLGEIVESDEKVSLC